MKKKKAPASNEGLSISSDSKGSLTQTNERSNISNPLDSAGEELFGIGESWSHSVTTRLQTYLGDTDGRKDCKEIEGGADDRN